MIASALIASARRILMAGLCVIVAILGVHMVLRRTITNAMLFHPGSEQARDPADVGMDFEEVWLETHDGVRILSWWIPGGSPALVMFHGNAGTISDRLENARAMRDLGLSLLMVEYRGYGGSEGKASEEGLYLDATAALAEVRRRTDGPVVLFGRSLGGAVAIDLAARAPVEGLIVESTFTSLGDMARTVTGVGLARHLVAYSFDSLSKISQIHCPTLIIHGVADEMIPFAMSERLREAAAPGATLHRVEGGLHNDTWIRGGVDYWDAWRRFVEPFRRP